MNAEKIKNIFYKNGICIVLFFLTILTVSCYFIFFNENIEKNRRVFFINVLLNINAKKTHNLNNEYDYNVVYMNDGRIEVVVNSFGSIINKDIINKGKQNYFSPFKQPLEHFSMDVHPWLQWGEDYITSKDERINAYIDDFIDALVVIRKNWDNRITDVDAYYNREHIEIAIEFFDNVFNDNRLNKYKFSSNDKWVKNDESFNELKNNLINTIKDNL
ncbi:MAG: hypothetical protein LBC92_04810 [Rickettsiales bacterium]|jgi:hypothetical protein|nr:hypothetical protein [Rickettsiales bacterium]